MTRSKFKVGDAVRVKSGAEYIITVPGSVGCVVSLSERGTPGVRFVMLGSRSHSEDAIFNINPLRLESVTADDLTADEIVALVKVKLKYL